MTQFQARMRAWTPGRALLRQPAADGVLVGMAGLHALVLCVWPGLLVVGLGTWWHGNTVAHYFVHRPFFRSAPANAAFSVFSSLLLGLPQSLWQQRHLAHHAGRRPRLRWTAQFGLDLAAVVGLWGLLAWSAPSFFLSVYLPGLGLGLALAALHGHYEHVGGGTISHYGRVYNLLFFNDGYHVEHHAHPGRDWRNLAAGRVASARASAWPAILRWLDAPLDRLERIVIRSALLQRFVLATHRRAWTALLPRLGAPRRIGIVGGGLFPRTALLLGELLPEAELTVIDGSAASLTVARRWLPPQVRCEQAWFDALTHDDFDLLVFPLAYRGDDAAALRLSPPAPRAVFHAWLWDRRGSGPRVSFLLLKRLAVIESDPRREDSA